jgi:hypothetical protein
MKLSNLVNNVFYSEVEDKYAIHAGKYIFYIPKTGLDHLKYGLEAHYTQTEYLLGCSPDELKDLGKIKPRRGFLEEIEYQIERKGFDTKHIQANELISRLPVFSQSRNRNGKQSIADKRWRDALKNENPDVIWLKEYYEYEEEYIKSHFTNINWTKGSFAISPCHIYPAKKDRKEDSWTPDKICRDLSIINKAFDKISSSPLNGKHAITKEDAHIAIKYLDGFNFNDLSVTRQILYMVLENRISNGFYNFDRFTDIGLGI